MELSAQQLEQYATDGYLVIPGFLSEQEVASLETARARIVDSMDPAEHRISIFSTQEDKQVSRTVCTGARPVQVRQEGRTVGTGARPVAKQLTREAQVRFPVWVILCDLWLIGIPCFHGRSIEVAAERF